jgi:hypothetical protein
MLAPVGRATVAGMPDPEDREGDSDHRNSESGGDLLTIALLVFFVSLLLVVTALLVVPTLLPPAR